MIKQKWVTSIYTQILLNVKLKNTRRQNDRQNAEARKQGLHEKAIANIYKKATCV